MDDVSTGPNAIRPGEEKLPTDRKFQMASVIAALEENLVVLEELDYSLAAALLDHALAEVKLRHAELG